MVLCNITKRLEDDTFYIDFSACNLTLVEMTSKATSTDLRDSEGAMEFIIAVILVYGLAVMGVLGLGFFGRKKRQSRRIDKEAVEFVKHYDAVRRSIDKKNRVGAISELLRSVHYPQLKSSSGFPDRKNLFGNFENFALPMATQMTTIGEDQEKGADENNNIVTTERSMSNQCDQENDNSKNDNGNDSWICNSIDSCTDYGSFNSKLETPV